MLICLIFCILVIAPWTFFQDRFPLLKHAYFWVFCFPLHYLPGCTVYLYTKSILEKTKKITRKDYLHFVPALLHFLELLPFYLLNAEKKQFLFTKYLLNPQHFYQLPYFVLPMNIHVFLKMGSYLFYILLTVPLLIKFYKNNPLWITRNNHIWFWLTRHIGIHLISILAPFIIMLLYKKDIYRDLLIMTPVIFILTIVVFLFFKPTILYGLNYKENYMIAKAQNEQEITNPKTFKLSDLKTKEYKEKIELLIQNEKIFLIKNYSLTDMSADLDIPLHHLSQVINKEFGTNFVSFINNSRIDYIIKHRYDPAWSQFSLEGIAAEAGFNSKNSFFKAFKIATGKTPSEYFKNNPA